MRVEHFGGSLDVTDVRELDQVLEFRDERDSNELYMSDHDEQFQDARPALMINLRGTAAHAYFLPGGDHAGFVALGDEERTDEVMFYGSDIVVYGPHIITVQTARKIAHEFLRSRSRSTLVEWDEL